MLKIRWCIMRGGSHQSACSMILVFSVGKCSGSDEAMSLNHGPRYAGFVHSIIGDRYIYTRGSIEVSRTPYSRKDLLQSYIIQLKATAGVLLRYMTIPTTSSPCSITLLRTLCT